MKLGILVCDHVQDQLQGEFGDYPQMFKDTLLKVDESLDIDIFEVVRGQFPTDIDQCDAYLTTGSRWGVNDGLPWVEKLSDFIRQLYHAKKGFVGICFGHQLLAQALGGEVNESDKGWGVGIAFSDVCQQQVWMEPYQSKLNLLVSHKDQIVKLPTAAKVLLANEFCPYSMIQIADHFLGIQGHPEFSHSYSHALMDSRKDRIPSDVIEKGVLSLAHQTDAVITTQWLLNFLKQTMLTAENKMS